MLSICEQFQLQKKAISCTPYGNGHINATYLVKTENGPDYILQKLSRQAFHDIPALMANIELVTGFLAKQYDDPRRSLHLVPTLYGKSYYVDDQGEYYRVYDFVTHSISLDTPERETDLYECARAFGQFQCMLKGLSANQLSETIPHFHDTPSRYNALKSAIASDPFGRVRECGPEIAFALAHEEDGAKLMNMLSNEDLPLRVTHNDTKLNNVMLDIDTHEPVCVIDLDTVMPGLAANDFGDLVRFGANTGAEDEKDLSKISLSFERYEQLLKGFLDACRGELTQNEINTLPLGGKLMTLECGVRFLTDYLCGDVYFRIHRPEHNLDRTRTQFKLVADMEAKWDIMMAALQNN